MASKIEVINSMKTLHGGLSHIEQLSMAKQQALNSMNAICNEIKFEASKIKKANQSVDDDMHEIKGKLAGQLSMIPTILLSIVIIVISAFICLFTENSVPLYIGLAFCVFMVVQTRRKITKKVTRASRNSVEKAKLATPDVEKKIAEYRIIIDKAQERLQLIDKEISDTYGNLQPYLQSFPPAYQYPYAIERFVFFLENQRADSLKEAINLYEDEVYKEKMLAEQRKQTAYAAISAAANVQTAYNTGKLVDYAAEANSYLSQIRDNTARTADNTAETAFYAKKAAKTLDDIDRRDRYGSFWG